MMKKSGTEIARNILLEQLGLKSRTLDVNKSMFELGLDLNSAEQFIRTVSKLLDASDLPTTIVYEYPTLAAFGKFIDTFQQGTLSAIKLEHHHIIHRPIVISGCSCKFPNNSSAFSSYTDLLLCGKNCISDYPSGHTIAEPTASKIQGGFLGNMQSFDSSFFGISPREAISIDLNERLFLEESFCAVQNAALTLENVKQSHTAVLVGVWSTDHRLCLVSTGSDLESAGGCLATACAAHLSYFFDASGPAISIDTASSSAAVALHLGKKMLENGECNIVLCTADNLFLDTSIYHAFVEKGIFSQSGLCKSFDVDADGYGCSEGVASLIIETAGSTNCLAKLHGCACNQDGQGTRLFASNSSAMTAVALGAIENASTKSQIEYVEAHGSGNIQEDDIEFTTIIDVQKYLNSGPHFLSSVKSIIGHMEACAGMTSILRCASILNKGIGVHLHLTSLMSTHHRDRVILPFVGAYDSLDAIMSNCYGLTGTNISMILKQENVVSYKDSCYNDYISLLPIAAKSWQALEQLVKSFTNLLHQTSCYVPTVAKSVQSSAEPFKKRVLGYGFDNDGVAKTLNNRPPVHTAKRIAWLYPGQQQSNQEHISISSCYMSLPLFQEVLQKSERCVNDIIESCNFIPTGPEWTSNIKHIARPGQFQIHIFLLRIQYALTQIWQCWLSSPTAVSGHSLGEIMAAYTAGFISYRDACLISIATAVFAQQSLGHMLAVGCDKKHVRHLQSHYDSIWISCHNSPNQIVLSGYVDPTRNLLKWCGIRSTIVLNLPIHSPRMKIAGEKLMKYIGHIEFNPPINQYVSSTYGLQLVQMNHNYWTKFISSEVKYFGSVQQMVNMGIDGFLEIGADTVLANMTGLCLRSLATKAQFEILSSFKNEQEEWLTICESLSKLYVGGLSIDWHSVKHIHHPVIQCVPRYPFDNQNHWFLRNSKKYIEDIIDKDSPRLSSNSDKHKPNILADIQKEQGYNRSFSELMTLVENVVRKVLNLKSETTFDHTCGFMDMGMNSIKSVEFADELNAAIGNHTATIGSAFAYDYPNIGAVVKYLATPCCTSDNMHVPTSTKQQADDADGTIYVVGLAANLPNKSNTISEFFQTISRADDCACEIPLARFNIDNLYDENRNGTNKIYVKKAALLTKSVALFDNFFFNISPKEAKLMDPQQRLLLQTTWHGLENSNLKQWDLREKQCGIFVGCQSIEYSDLERGMPTAYDVGAVNPSVISGRIGFFLGTQGPALTVSTACSSSLVALHLACNFINAECTNKEVQIVAGTDLCLSARGMMVRCRSMMLSPDCHCKTMDDDADGYLRGEGCACVIIQHKICRPETSFAVVANAVSNQDGASSTLTAPNGRAQQKLLNHVLVGFDSVSVGYIELHGTGTALGDPIEMNALNSSRIMAGAVGVICLGSIKVSMGHCEGSAGIAGLLKLVMSLKTMCIMSHINWSKLNKHIKLHNAVACFPFEGHRWNFNHTGTVSSFGASGTNCCALLASLMSTKVSTFSQQSSFLFPFSSKTVHALKKLICNWKDFCLKCTDSANFIHMSYSLCFRSHFKHRNAIVTNSLAHLMHYLEISRVSSPLGHVPKICYLFTGQGAEYMTMGTQLMGEFNKYRQHYDMLAEDSMLPEEIINYELISQSQLRNSVEFLHHEGFQQSILFCLECTLVQTWREWGVGPSVMIGHSLGEVTAAAVGEMMSLKNAIMLTAIRGKAMRLPTGVMFAAKVEAGWASLFTNNCINCWLSVENAQKSCVLSLGLHDMMLFKISSVELGIETKHINNYGFHCPLMSSAAEAFHTSIKTIDFQNSNVPIYSNLTGQLLINVDADYWRRQMTSIVNFNACVTASATDDIDCFLEIGPHPILLPLVSQNPLTGAKPLLAALKRTQQDVECMLGSAAELFCTGVDINCTQLIDLKVCIDHSIFPNYAFHEKFYWVDVSKQSANNALYTSDNYHPLLGHQLSLADPTQFSFEQTICFDSDNSSLLLRYCSSEFLILPACVLLDMMCTAVVAVNNCEITYFEITNFEITANLCIDLEKEHAIQTWCSKISKYTFKLSIYTKEITWQLNAHAIMVISTEPDISVKSAQWMPTKEEKINKCDIYQKLHKSGLLFGSGIRSIDTVQILAENKMMIETDIIETSSPVGALNPGILDAIIQSLFYKYLDTTYFVSSIKKITFHNKLLKEQQNFTLEIEDLPNTNDEVIACCKATISGEQSVVLTANHIVCSRLPSKNGESEYNIIPLQNYNSDYSVQIKSEIHRILHIKSDSTLDNNRSFNRLGFDSLSLMELINGINANLPNNVKLANSDVYDYNTIEKLSEFINEKCQNVNNHPPQIDIINSIKPVYKLQALPLSANQQQLYFMFQIESAVKYKQNDVIRLRLKSRRWNEKIFQHTFSHQIQNHTSLRTTFKPCATGTCQIIKSLTEGQNTIILGQWQGDARNTYMDRYYCFELDVNIPMVTRAMTVEDGVIVTICLHNILKDGWSFKLLLEPIFQNKTKLFANSVITSKITATHIHYVDYAVWQNKWLSSEHAAKQLDYWENILQGHEELIIPFDKNRPTQTSHRGNNIFMCLQSIEAIMHKIAKTVNLSMFAIISAAYSLLLADFCNRTDILFGTYVSMRRHKELETIIGYFANCVPIRNKLMVQATLPNQLELMRYNLESFHDNLEVPFGNIVERLGIERTASVQPLVQARINVMFENHEFWNNTLYIRQSDQIHIDTADFPVTTNVGFWQHLSYTGISLDYDTDLFYSSTMKILGNSFCDCLNAMSHLTHSVLFTLQNVAISRQCNEKANVVSHFRDAAQITLSSLLYLQEGLCGSSVFLMCLLSRTSRNLIQPSTMRQSKQIGQLHRRTCNSSVRIDSTISVCMKKTVSCITTFLSIITSGMAFVTLDVSFPEERINSIRSDSYSSLMVTDLANNHHNSVELLHEETCEKEAYYAASTNLDLLYAIYTSGTTGKPKGIAINSKTAMNLLSTHPIYGSDKYCMHTDSILLQSHNFIFDGGLCDIFTTMASGAALHLCPDALQPQKEIAPSKATCAEIAIAIVNELSQNDLNMFHNFEHFYHGGSSLEEKPLTYLQNISVSTFNSYGPTECTIDSINVRGNLGNSAQLIGTPFTNYLVFLGNHPCHKPLPIALPCELSIGGDCLARGYYGNHRLTTDKFPVAIQDREITVRHGSRLYHTGDLVKRTCDGSLFFIGRNDFQVKIRGQRIELEEIERVITSHNLVLQAVAVTVGNTARDKQIAAYFVSVHLSPDNLYTYLSKQLPRYMVPAFLIKMDSLPLNASLKIDRTALPSPKYQAENGTGINDSEQDSDMEKLLIQIWQQVLGHSKFNRGSIFFQVGGNSITALGIVNKIKTIYPLFTIRDVFECQTIEQQAEKLSSHKIESLTQVQNTLKLIVSEAGISGSCESVHKSGGDAANLIKLHKIFKTKGLALSLQDIFLLESTELMAQATAGILSQADIPIRNSTVIPMQADGSPENVLIFETFFDFMHLNSRSLLDRLSKAFNLFSCHNRPWLQTECNKHGQGKRIIEFLKLNIMNNFEKPEQAILGGHSAGGMLSHLMATELEQSIYATNCIILIDAVPALRPKTMLNRIHGWILFESILPRNSIEQQDTSLSVAQHAMHMNRLFLHSKLQPAKHKLFLFTVLDQTTFLINDSEWQQKSFKPLASDQVLGSHYTMFNTGFHSKLCTKFNAIVAEHSISLS